MRLLWIAPTIALLLFSSFALAETQPEAAPDSSASARLSATPLFEPMDSLRVVAPRTSVTDTLEPRAKSSTGAVLRSMLIPGWGQLYTGHWFKALAFLGTDAGILYGAFFQHGRYVDALELADNSKTEEERVRYEHSADFYRDDRNRLIWWAAGVTLLSAVDAYVEAELYGFHIDPTLGTAPDGQSVKVGISITGFLP